MLAAIAAGIEDPAAIVVPKARRRAASAPEQTQGGQHLIQPFSSARKRNIVERRQNGRVQKQIERVHVVIR